MSASSQCPHIVVKAKVDVRNFTDTNIHYAEVHLECSICGAKGQFRGLPLGTSPEQPTMSLDGLNVSLPFTFGDEEYDGKAIGLIGRMVK